MHTTHHIRSKQNAQPSVNAIPISLSTWQSWPLTKPSKNKPLFAYVQNNTPKGKDWISILLRSKVIKSNIHPGLHMRVPELLPALGIQLLQLPKIVQIGSDLVEHRFPANLLDKRA
jgi:hypothetical protein